MQVKLNEPPQFAEVEQIARRIGCSEKHVFELLRSGKIRGLRIGTRAIRIEIKSVDEFIDNNRLDPLEIYA